MSTNLLLEVGSGVSVPFTMATVKDLVCGMEIDPATAAASEEYEGQTYYFCSESCHQRFVADPQQFAA